MIDSLGPLGSCSSKVGIAPSLDDKTAIMDGLESTLQSSLLVSGSNRRGVAVPVDPSMPAGKAGVLTPSVWMEEGVLGTVGLASKSTSKFLNH